ncbi:hypothetical protein CHU98_g374 [Xylaria longipes]|nr:hypothetical protein CHU98_g374 [Xylaria longipes]
MGEDSSQRAANTPFHSSSPQCCVCSPHKPSFVVSGCRNPGDVQRDGDDGVLAVDQMQIRSASLEMILAKTSLNPFRGNHSPTYAYEEQARVQWHRSLSVAGRVVLTEKLKTADAWLSSKAAQQLEEGKPKMFCSRKDIQDNVDLHGVELVSATRLVAVSCKSKDPWTSARLTVMQIQHTEVYIRSLSDVGIGVMIFPRITYLSSLLRAPTYPVCGTDEVRKVADWEPGTCMKSRRSVGMATSWQDFGAPARYCGRGFVSSVQ